MLKTNAIQMAPIYLYHFSTYIYNAAVDRSVPKIINIPTSYCARYAVLASNLYSIGKSFMLPGNAWDLPTINKCVWSGAAQSLDNLIGALSQIDESLQVGDILGFMLPQSPYLAEGHPYTHVGTVLSVQETQVIITHHVLKYTLKSDLDTFIVDNNGICEFLNLDRKTSVTRVIRARNETTANNVRYTLTPVLKFLGVYLQIDNPTFQPTTRSD